MERHLSHNLLPHINPLSYEPSPRFSSEALMEIGAHLAEPSCTPPGSPIIAPVKRDAPFPEPSFHYLSQFLVNGPPPQVPQRDPYRERHPSTEPSASLPLKIHLSLRVLVRDHLPCFPTGSLWREMLLHQSHWTIYS